MVKLLSNVMVDDHAGPNKPTSQGYVCIQMSGQRTTLEIRAIISHLYQQTTELHQLMRSCYLVTDRHVYCLPIQMLWRCVARALSPILFDNNLASLARKVVFCATEMLLDHAPPTHQCVA